MRYTWAAAFRQALETRLRAIGRDQGSSLVRLPKGVAFDRLMARRWLLIRVELVEGPGERS